MTWLAELTGIADGSRDAIHQALRMDGSDLVLRAGGGRWAASTSGCQPWVAVACGAARRRRVRGVTTPGPHPS